MIKRKSVLLRFIPVFTLVLCLWLWGCDEKKAAPTSSVVKTTISDSNPLPSWNEGATKSAILDYVARVTTKGGPDFIPVQDRIATFDNDGTLWSEQPAYFQLFFAIDRVKALAGEHPEWADKQPFKAVLENDMEALMASGIPGILQLVMASHGGMTADEFEQIVVQWLRESRHPRFDRPYTDLIYQPMLELLDYLRAHDFKTFILSAGGIDFMRVWSEDAYGIPSDQVMGSSIKTVYEYKDGNAVIRRLPEMNFIDDKAGKPVGIHQFIGKRPVFASGNSDGDLQMLQYTDSNSYLSLQIYLHHTDAEREWAYDRESHIGRLDKGLDEAREKGWTVIDMKKDWKVIYPFELETK